MLFSPSPVNWLAEARFAAASPLLFRGRNRIPPLREPPTGGDSPRDCVESVPRRKAICRKNNYSHHMLINIIAAKCVGIGATPVTVEVDINKGIGIHLVGLADASVRESLLRTITALQAAGYHVPGRKIVINLAPADMHKKGGGYDLPIALGIIAASAQEELPLLGDYLVMGELGLDGSVRDIPGALPLAELAASLGLRGCILPYGSALEAAEVPTVEVYAVRSLQEALRVLRGGELATDLRAGNCRSCPGGAEEALPRGQVMDFADIVGQGTAKRGLEVAAAGSHNVIMVGAPGSGKSSLARALAGILPPMDRKEALVVSKIYSVAGKGVMRKGLMRTRPFRSPHYSSSMAAMLGGGSGDNVMPGEVSLAQSGVLFLDEYMQMPKALSEALRGPLEDRTVSISRLRSKVVYPASFMLVAAANPCPCGYYGEGDRCNCSPGARHGYFGKLSGPVLDRIDVQLWLHSVSPELLVRHEKEESSAEVAARVLQARDIQAERFRDEDISVNAEMNNSQLRRYCLLDRNCEALLEKLMKRSGFSARAYTRIIKMARTIADLEGAPEISVAHISEAAGYRFLDKII